jgi:Uma2 family endonuclease
MPGNDAMNSKSNPGVKLTYDDFVHFPDDGDRHELIDGERDETIKRRLYERMGVSEYWIVDPETDVVRVYRRTTERFDRAPEISREASDVLTTPLLPGLALPLTRLLRD